jgi:hypothetical protein
MAALLATGTTALNSADFTLSGETSSLFLVSTAGIPAGAWCDIQVKGANGLYYPMGALNSITPFLVLSSPGTYRVARAAGVDVGVDRV